MRSSSSSSTWHVACSLLLLALAATTVSAQSSSNTTLPNDVAAITSLWNGLQPFEGSVLANWAPDETDPCTGGWGGVICSCNDLPNRALAAACQIAEGPASNTTGPRRVIGLDLGPVANVGGQKLSGRISPAIGGLQELLYLDLSNNELTGPLPDTLSSLSKLQWLLLDNNLLTGTLPAYFGGLPNLKQVQLQNNNFSGPVPDQWCSSNSAVYDISRNPFLCGFLSYCLHDTMRVNDVQGTYISADFLGSAGGACDSTPPDCDADVGCVIWTPTYWTSRGIVAFNFTGFMDYQSGISRYQWGIGSKPYQADVVPLADVTATRVLKDIKYAGGTQKMFVTPVVNNLTTVSLLDGQSYYVTVVAWNGAGPPVSINTSSLAVLVDTTGPVAGTVYNTFTFQQAASTASRTTLQVSWDNFTDTQSGVTGYVVQFFQQKRHANSTTYLLRLTDPLAVAPTATTNKLQVQAAQPLEDGVMYIAQVTATNGAGLTTSAQGVPITVAGPGDDTVPTERAAFIGVFCSLGCLVVGAALAVYWMKQKVRQHNKDEKRRTEDAKQLKALMYALSSQGDVPAAGQGGSLTVPRKVGEVSEQEVAFVFTDIESSTELSQQDGEAFKQVQEVHDQLMREGIAKHGGYEITTEGDSFQVAFTNCHAAMAFCLDIQYRLLEQTWPKQVLALNACKIIRDPETGQALFAGPRVRMGLHWAREGTVAMRLHNLTRHKVFAGPAVQITNDVSEAANGGQILLTEDAVLKLTEDMSQAGFPIIRLVGMFQLPSVPCPVFLFAATEIVGKPLNRQFAGLRKIKKVWPAVGAKLPAVLEYNISMPPLPNASNSLVFVSLRLTSHPKSKQCDLPRSLAAKFEEVFATSAQQFKGYLFQAHENAFKKGIWTVAFQNSMDALRFSHAAQMLLMYVKWPSNATEYIAEQVPSPDGRFLFKGPRVCMAIHESPDFFVSEDPSIEDETPRRAMCFAGPAVTLPLVLTYAGRGGQVILSEQAWDSVKPIVTQHPGAVSIISLGMHVLSDDFPTPMLLMEVMPNLLARRNFSPIMTKRLVEPGFRDAPDPRQPMTIVFAKVAKPEEVVAAEKGAGGVEVCDAQISMTIQAYQLAVGKYTTVARKLLHRYNGYECKEPEPGKFTLAFKDLSDAIRWACHVQEEIMYVDWPEELLKMKGCGPEWDNEDNLVWRGLRLRIGMSYGMVSNQKPLNTGRADYFGVLPNGAARVMALATPGQVLIEAANPPLNEDGRVLLQHCNPTFLQMHYVPGSHQHHKLLDAAGEAAKAANCEEGPLPDYRAVRIHAVGYFLLRGLDNPRLLYSAETYRLQSRQLKISQDMWAPPMGPFGPGANSSFASRDSFRHNWSTWVERTKASWVAKRLSPRDSTSPTSSAEAFKEMFSARRAPQHRPPSPSTPSSTAVSTPHGAAATGAGGAGFFDAPTGAQRSKSSLSAGANPAGMFSSFSRGAAVGTFSEAGRAGVGTGFAQGSLGGGAACGAAAACSSSSPGAGCFAATDSPRPFISSRSETAAAGRGLQHEARLAMLPLPSMATGPVVIDATVPSETESSGTPAAHSMGTASGSAAWLVSGDGEAVAAGTLQQQQQRLQGSGASASSDPVACAEHTTHSLALAGSSNCSASVRAPAAMEPGTPATSDAQLAATVSSQRALGAEQVQLQLQQRASLTGLRHSASHEMTDPLLGSVCIPPIHTVPQGGATDSSSTPAAASSSAGTPQSSSSPETLQATSGLQQPTGRLSTSQHKPHHQQQPHQQQPHQQLQQQQRLRSQQLLERSSGGGTGLTSAEPGSQPTGIQPWQQQQQQHLETWHEQQRWQQPGQEAGLGAGSSANGGLVRADSSPVSLCTTMTSGLDADDASMQAQAQQQQQAVATMEKIMLDRPGSFTVTAPGMRSLLASVAGNMRPRLSGGSSSGSARLSWREALMHKVGVRRRSTSSMPSFDMPRNSTELRQSLRRAGYGEDDEESLDPEVQAVQQQHGMLRQNQSSAGGSASCSSAPGSRGPTGGGGTEQANNPATSWARDVAQTWINLHHNSMTAMQSPLAQQLSASHADLEASTGPASAAAAAGAESAAAAAAAASGAATCGDSCAIPQQGVRAEGGGAGLQTGGAGSCSSSPNKGSIGYTYADSSYSPKHCRPSERSTDPVRLWHGMHGAQQQEAPSSVQQQQPPPPAAAAAEAAQQEQQRHQYTPAAGLSQDTWRSGCGLRGQPATSQQQRQQEQHTHDALVQQLEQGMLSVQQQQQLQGRAAPSYFENVLEMMSYNPDTAELTTRLVANGGASFCAAETADTSVFAKGWAWLGWGPVAPASASATAATPSSSREAQQQQQQQTRSQPGGLLTPRAALQQQLHQKRQTGVPVFTADEYRDWMLQQRREHDSRFIGHASPSPQHHQQQQRSVAGSSPTQQHHGPVSPRQQHQQLSVQEQQQWYQQHQEPHNSLPSQQLPMQLQHMRQQHQPQQQQHFLQQRASSQQVPMVAPSTQHSPEQPHLQQQHQQLWQQQPLPHQVVSAGHGSRIVPHQHQQQQAHAVLQDNHHAVQPMQQQQQHQQRHQQQRHQQQRHQQQAQGAHDPQAVPQPQQQGPARAGATAQPAAAHLPDRHNAAAGSAASTHGGGGIHSAAEAKASVANLRDIALHQVGAQQQVQSGADTEAAVTAAAAAAAAGQPLQQQQAAAGVMQVTGSNRTAAKPQEFGASPSCSTWAAASHARALVAATPAAAAGAPAAATAAGNVAKRAATLLQGFGTAAIPATLQGSSPRPVGSGGSSPRFASATGSPQGGGSSHSVSQQHSFGGSPAQASPRSSLPTTPRSAGGRHQLASAAAAPPFSSAAVAAAAVLAMTPSGGSSGHVGAAGLHGHQQQHHTQHGSSGINPGSPRFGPLGPPSPHAHAHHTAAMPAHGLHSSEGAEGLCGVTSHLSTHVCDATHMCDEDEECDDESCCAGVYLGRSVSPAGLRARTPSCSVPGQKDSGLGIIPELTGMEGRGSDPNEESGA